MSSHLGPHLIYGALSLLAVVGLYASLRRKARPTEFFYYALIAALVFVLPLTGLVSAGLMPQINYAPANTLNYLALVGVTATGLRPALLRSPLVLAAAVLVSLGSHFLLKF